VQTLNVFKATSFSLLLAVVLAGCSASNQTGGSIYSQCFYDYAISRTNLPEFDARVFCSPDSSGARLDVYVSVKLSRLNFQKDSSTYHASYISTVRIRREDETPLSREIDRTVTRNSYPGANDNSYDAFLVSFNVGSGKYSVDISIDDEQSRVRAFRTFTTDVPLVAGRKLVLSDILLLARYDSLGESHKITPFILSNVGLLSDTVKFFTVLLSEKSSTDSVFFSLYKLQNPQENSAYLGPQMLTSRVWSADPCSSVRDSTLVYTSKFATALREGQAFIFGEIPKPPRGNYLLKVVARDPEEDTASSTMEFRVRNEHFPEISDDLADMVGSLNYIAYGNEIKKIIDVKSDSAVKANLLEFWKDHGGFEKMARYYQRVGQANRLFGGCIDGWRTPMGMFFIVCGAPDNVECQGIWDERWTYVQASTQNSMMIVFRLVRETTNISDRFYKVDGIYSNADIWNYYVNEWRY